MAAAAASRRFVEPVAMCAVPCALGFLSHPFEDAASGWTIGVASETDFLMSGPRLGFLPRWYRLVDRAYRNEEQVERPVRSLKNDCPCRIAADSAKVVAFSAVPDELKTVFR